MFTKGELFFNPAFPKQVSTDRKPVINFMCIFDLVVTATIEKTTSYRKTVKFDQ